MFFFFFSSRRRHTRWTGDWSSDVCSSDLIAAQRRDRGSCERKRRRRGGDRTELPHDAVDDASRRAPGKKVGERGMASGFALERGAVHFARRSFGAEQISGADLNARGAER